MHEVITVTIRTNVSHSNYTVHECMHPNCFSISSTACPIYFCFTSRISVNHSCTHYCTVRGLSGCGTFLIEKLTDSLCKRETERGREREGGGWGVMVRDDTVPKYNKPLVLIQ